MEGPDTPKLCLGVGDGGRGPEGQQDADMRRIKQLAWTTCSGREAAFPGRSPLCGLIERFKAGGLTLCNMMIGGFPNTIYGRPGRDEEIEKVIQSIRAAGKGGPAGDRIQLLCPPRDGGLLRGDRQGGRGLYRRSTTTA